MPEYDLGTAHGRIKIDVDDSGTKKANQTVDQFEKTMRTLDRRMAQMQTSMNNVEREIRALTREFQKANEEAESLEQSVNDLDSSFSHAGNASQAFGGDIRAASLQMMHMARVAKTVVPPLSSLQKVMRSFSNSRYSGGFRVLDTLWKSGAIATGIGALTSRLIGLNKVMQNTKSWQRGMLRFGGAIQGVVAGGAFLNFLTKGRIGAKFWAASVGLAATKVGDLSDKILQLGLKFGNFGLVSSKAFIGTVKGLDFLAKGISRVFDSSTGLGKGLNKMAHGAMNTAIGFGLMRTGAEALAQKFQKLGWAGKIVAASIAGIAVFGPLLMDVLGKSLVGISNLLAGLLDGIKQLSGGLLTLPGAISMVVASVSTLMAAFIGLGDKFKDVLSDDPIAAAEALAKLPPHLKALGQALRDVKPKFKELQTAVQQSLFAGVDKQITSLTSMYLPRLQKGMVTVAESMRRVKDQYVDFLAESQTQKDTSSIYNATAQAIEHISKAVKPASEGMRDLSVVGAQFIADMTGGLPRLTKRFAEWAETNRKNGNLMKWMQESWQGLKDFTNGIKDASKAIWKLFTIFASNNGDNWLSRFADAMERFNNAVQQSAASGTLKKIGDYVRNLGTEHIATFLDVWRSVWDTIKDATPVIKDISHYASNVMVPAFKMVAQVIETLFDILDFTHLAPFIGVIFGITSAFIALYKVIGMIGPIVKIVVGAFMFFRGVPQLLSGIVDVLYYFGPAGRAASTSITRLGKSFRNLTGAVAIITAVWMAFNQHAEYVKESSKVIDDSLEKNKQSYQKLQRAFAQNGGSTGKTATDAIVEKTKTNFEQLEEVADRAPSLWQHLMSGLQGGDFKNQNWFEKAFAVDFGQSADFNEIQKVADAAKRAMEGFKEFGVSQEVVNKAIQNGGPVYDKLYADLMKAGEATGLAGDNARAAAAKLKEWREEVQQAAADAATLGEGGLKVADGIQQIAGAAGDANEKLNGLRTILQGLGIIETNEMEAAAQYAQELRDLGNAAQEVVAPGENLSNIIDAQTGKLNLNTQSAINLSNRLTALGQEYQNAITNGTDVGTAYAQAGTQLDEFTDQINNAAGQMVITKEQMRALAQAAGTFDPKALDQKLNQVLDDSSKKKILLELGIDSESIAEIQRQIPGLFEGVATTEQNGLHGGYSERARRERQKAQGQSYEDFKKFAEDMSTELADTTDEAKESGRKFVDAFANGLSSNDAAIRAAEVMAEDVLKRFHRSPPQKGPLALHGDAAKYGGKMFASSYATGIATGLSGVTGAADGLASAAAQGVSMGNGEKPGSRAGEFLGQLLDLTGFIANFAQIATRITDTVFQIAKFMSDPMGEGKFFGKNLGFKRTVSDAEFTRRQEDRDQERLINVMESGSRPNNMPWDRYGMPLITGPGELQRDASKGDIQAAIAAEGQRRGASAEDIAAALAVVQQESGYDPVILGKGKGGEGRDAYGLFQQTEGMWGTKEELTNPNIAIMKYWDSWGTTSGTAAERALAVQRPATVANGGYDAGTIGALMEQTRKDLESLTRSGGLYPKQSGGFIPGLAAINGGLPAPSILTDMNGVKSGPQAANAAALVALAFPEITQIGGGRTTASGYPTAPGSHDAGMAIDIAIPRLSDGSFDMKLGDRINDWLMNNAEAMGIRYTIWRDIGRNIKDGTRFRSSGHQDHIDVQFDGGKISIGPNGTKITMPHGASSYLSQDMFGPPLEPGLTVAPPGETITFDAEGKPQRVHGADGGPPGELWDAATGQPWTEERRQAYFDANAKQYELGEMTMEEFQKAYSDNNYAKGTGADIIEAMKADPQIAAAYALRDNPRAYSEGDTGSILSSLDSLIETRKTADTPKSRYEASALQSLQSSIMDSSGFSREANPIDTISGIASNAAGVASDIIGTVVTSLESVGATKNITETLNRGMQGTKDVGKVVDNVQKYLELGAKISGSVASVSGLIGSMVGAGASGDPTGGAGGAAAAIQGVSTIASLVQAGFETTNAVIDLTQEAVKIAGSYMGDFMGHLVGGAGGPLAGNVRFLLDQQTNQLLTYTAENSMDKRVHDVPFKDRDFESRQQGIGNINVYGGPGSDPRDLTRQMMFQVNAAQYAGALSQ